MLSAGVYIYTQKAIKRKAATMTVRREDLAKFHDPVSVQTESNRVKWANEMAAAMLAAASELVS